MKYFKDIYWLVLKVLLLLSLTHQVAWGAGEKIYYTTNAPEYAVKSANPDGSGIATLLPDDGVSGWNDIAVDPVNSKLYFFDATTKQIQRTNLDGTGKTAILTSAATVNGLAVDGTGGKIYYTTSDPEYAVKRANLDGSGVTTLLPDDGASGWQDITVDPFNAKLYFYDGVAKQILRTNLDGTGKTAILTSAYQIMRFAIDALGGKIYYTTGATEYSLKRANLDGSGVTTLLPDDGVSGWGEIVADTFNAKLYFFDGTAKQILRTNLDGTGKTAIITSASPVIGLAFPAAVPAAEIDVTGNSVAIADGDVTPSSSDHTDFGSVAVSSGTIVRTLTIRNLGNINLNLTGTPKVAVSGTNAADFTVTAQPTSPVAASGSTTFQVTFDPSAAGTRSGTLSISNDDTDENPYNFSIQGTGLVAAPTVTGISPSNGPTVGGTAVTIIGTNFTGATAVKFGSTDASNFTVNSANQITATAPAGSAGTVDITVTTAGGTSTLSASDQFTYIVQADLSITKTDGVTTATPGGSVTYTITASNAGPSNASGSTVSDTLPASLTCTWTCVGAGGGTCTAASSGNIYDTANLPSGGSVTYTASCTISAAATGTLANTATVTAPGGVIDQTPGNNSATDTDTLAPQADLAITNTDGVTTATPGGSVTYTITASNAGPSNAPGSTVSDTFPASLTCTWTCAGAGGGTCTASGSGNLNDTANLPSGGSVTYTASCTISASATGTLANTATATAPGGVTDPTPGNNSATDTDTLAPQADLAITKTDGITTATPGGSATYTITASNAGPSNAPGATVSDTFPASLTCTWTCAGAGGGTCTAASSGNINDTTNLPSGGSVTYTASCTISAAATGTLANTATVAAPGGVTDPTPGNNSATDTDTLVVPEINVTGNSNAIADGDATPSLTDHTDFGSVSVASGTVVRTFTIENTGNATLNLGSVVVSGATADFTVTALPASTVAAGGSTTFQVTFDPTATGTRSATLSIDNNDADENPYNFSIQGTGLNSAPTDLALSASAINENVAANSTVGTLSTTDPDGGDTFTYAMATGSGDTDNGAFNISGSSLRITNSPDFEAKSSYAVRVRSTDQGSLTYEKAFTITINNVNEAPIFTATPAISGTPVLGQLLGLTGTSTSDPDGDSVTLSYQWQADGGPISGATGSSYQLTLAELGKSVTCRVTADDGQGAPNSQTSVTTGGVVVRGDRIGVYRDGEWYFDLDDDGAWEEGGDGYGYFGSPDLVPVPADWNADGYAESAVYRAGQWFFDTSGNDQWEGEATDLWIADYGDASDIPVVGDWNGDGRPEIGVYRPGNSTWYLDMDHSFTFDPAVDITATFGFAGAIPVVGDWDGNGNAKIGVYFEGQWYLDVNGNFAWDDSPADTYVASFGAIDMRPVVGDWSGSGVDLIGAYRNGDWYLDLDGNGSWNPAADRQLGPFGVVGMVPLVGRW